MARDREGSRRYISHTMTDMHRPDPIDRSAPPRGSGIVVEDGDCGPRLVLPRLHGQGDVIAAVLSAGVAVWVGVWLDATSPGPAGPTLPWLAMAAVGVFFGALAVSEALPILARRVIEDAGDRIVLSWQVGARRVLRKALPKARIRAVERVRREAEPGVVEVRVGTDVYRVGRHLDGLALAWLEDALVAMVVSSCPPALRGPSSGARRE